MREGPRHRPGATPACIGTCSGPMSMRPKAAVIEPEPLMMPVTVPSERVLPPIDGCSARSAATALVMMLLGPPACTEHIQWIAMVRASPAEYPGATDD